MSESTVEAQQCLKAFVDGNYDVSLFFIDQIEEPHKLTDEKYGATLLHWAAAKGWLNIVKHLLEKFEFYPMCKSIDGSTPLIFACAYGQIDIAQYLITECKCDPMCKTINGNTPLHLASYNGHLGVIQYLITECNCDPMSKTNEGSTPLHSACCNGHFEVAQYLITECKCDPMSKTNKGSTPLHSACCNGHFDVAQYLITECKCDPMCKRNNAATPLHLASYNGHLDVIRYLITECKCDPMCKTFNGSTPLHSACFNGHFDVVQNLIIEHKCDPMCKTNNGTTPLHSACKNSHLPVIEYLLTFSERNNHETRNKLFMRKPLFLPDQTLSKLSKLNTCFSVNSYVNIVLLGNSGTGKSTLAQVILQTSSGRHLFGRFENAKDVELQTAGIVPTRIEHQQLGNIILHDLAGQPEFYSSHIAVLENLLQDYPAVFINFVNLHRKETLTCLPFWITVIESVSQNVKSPCHIVTVASHVDMITQSEFLSIKGEISKVFLSHLHSSNIINAGVMGLDCRKLGGHDFSPFMMTLSKCCQTIRSAKTINKSLYSRMLYTFLENETKAVHRVDQLFYRIEGREISHEYYLPETQQDVLETLSSLHSTGLITFLKNNHTPSNSWVIVDKRVLLAKVNGHLFAPETFKQHHDISSNTGIITQSDLTRCFPDLDLEMLTYFLCYMKICIEITSDILIYSNLQTNHPENSMTEEKLLFIPALIHNVQRPQEINRTIQFGWCLRCSNPHQFFLPRFFHVLILHLAYQYALPKTAKNPHNRRCTIWTNGILWSDVYGVTTLLEIVDSSRCVLLLMSCEQGYENNMITLRHIIIKDILSHQKDICPRLELQEFIIDPS